MYLQLTLPVLTLITIVPHAIEAQELPEYKCVLTNLPRQNGLCVAQIDCNYGIDDISTKLQNWDCIRHERHEYDYYNNYDTVTFDSDYDIIVNVENIDEDSATKTFINFKNEFSKIKEVTIRHGNLISIPAEIYRMIQAREVEITNTEVEEINLNNFLVQTMLSKVNVSHNLITVLHTDEKTAERIQPNIIATIDLSYNLIETLPNNYFFNFIQLQHLNLSNNHISAFDILTFEGISQLLSLHLSNNRIIEIGNTFARFTNLQHLSLDNNHLTTLLDYNFGTMTKLVTLNLSANYIEKIEDHAFQSLLKLETLDLGHNQIKIFSRLLLKKNNRLVSLSLLHNKLQSLEPKSFEGKNITKFYLQGNCLSGALEKDTFTGIFLNDLNLSGGKVTKLSDEAFSALQFDLVTLNLSSNSISIISKSAFSSLRLLNKLDLSFNNLQHLDFETKDLKKLAILNVRNNSIASVNTNSFKYLNSLTELDLSFNSITDIESNAFADLKNLKLLTIKQNILNNIFEANLFQGLFVLERIELMNTRTKSYRDQAFSGMTQLQTLNSSFGQLSDIGYNAFKDTGTLEVLDLSHNLIEHFVINTTSIIYIKKIYLNNNILKNITNQTFSNLTTLTNLNLANNNILIIQPLAFNSLLSLINLDLSLNSRMEITDNVFDNLILLSEVSLENVKNRFSFQNSNASIRILEISLCDIHDINKVFIFKIQYLSKLNLSRNKLPFIDKFSFQNMPFLSWLDLSSNMITYIQPGSFLYLNMLNTLNLAANNIPSLQFGVFDGLHNLRVLNLSRNAIHNFDAHLLHNTLNISTVSLDFNDIDIISYNDFFQTKINKLSIGGNRVSCENLAKLKKINFTKFEITAELLDYNTENVNGVSCRTAFNANRSIIWPVANNTGMEVMSAFASFYKIIEKLRVSIEKIGNNTVTNNNGDLKNISKLMETFISSNKSLYPSDEYFRQTVNSTNYLLKRLADSTNETQFYFGNISKYLINQSHESKITTEYQRNGESVTSDNQYNKYIKMLNEKTESLRLEFKTMYQNWQKSFDNNNDKDAPREDQNLSPINLADIKILLYCVVVCLAIIIIIYTSNVGYTFIKKRGYSHERNLRNSRQPIGNSMELD